ncbi:class I SAM-dependent methyltransferase [Pseudothauera rhizosphaerae]|uniref:Class I SAM-dependent methyltransferase n=1 Tax=Pseudothauera rhizosphaerae TaxID=2565932 RepID=A0A4S4AQ38_9RHOO|nr:class I SAM-dependent methyltransferase [Pseudothauera rhizosphaerae]
MTPVIELPFSAAYDVQHSRACLEKHRDGLRRHLSDLREQQLARRALAMAGEPRQVLDLSRTAGRFWNTLAEHPTREIIAADDSVPALDVAMHYYAPQLGGRIRPLRTSAFAIDLPDGSVDSIFCMDLLHRAGEPDLRLALLRELHRVTRDTLIVSLWVDGNYQAWRRQCRHRRRLLDGEELAPTRFVLPRATADAEFAGAGFRIVGHLDFLPLHSMRRVYVLRRA